MRLPSLPFHHGDPLDRLLVAQALLEGMALLTADEALAAYQGGSDANKLARAGLRPQTEILLALLREEPFHTPPPFEKLVGDLSGAYSRRITIQHRRLGIPGAESTAQTLRGLLPSWRAQEPIV